MNRNIRIAILLSVLGALLFSTVGHAAGKKEIEYTREFCWPKGWAVGDIIKRNGVKVAEVDCLGPEYAIEVGRAYKYYEDISQSLRYAVLTGQKPGLLMIVDFKDSKDLEYLRRAKEIIDGAFLPIKLWTVQK